jgi:type II secretory pathway component PulK
MADQDHKAEQERDERPRRRRSRAREQGVAILMVLACLAILLPFTASFNYNARVDWQSSVNASDDVRARQIQRGALRLSVLLFELQRMVFNQKQFREYVGAMDITQVAPYLMSVFGSQDGAEGLGALVGIDTSSLSELSITEGNFETRLEAESGKLNINCIAIAKDPKDKKNLPRSRTVEALEALMQPTLYDPMFDEEKGDGQRYSRQDVLTAIVDYIDDDRKRFDLVRLNSSGVAERYRYTELYDPYQAREARLDSVDEMHLVQGVDDDWMSAFGHELTTYGPCKVNLNFASPEQVALVLRHAVSDKDKWKTEGENFLLMTMPLANFVVEQREFNLFSKLDDVKDLVAKPDQFLNPMFFGEEVDQQNTMLPKVPDGMEVRINGGENSKGDVWGGLKEVATVEPERIYRVEITTTVGAVRKRLTAVYDMKYARSQSTGMGAWLYYRQE